MKAILVIDMPSDCAECQLCGYGGRNLEKYVCSLTKEHSEGPHLADCPLKPMPDKKGEISIDDTKISLKVNNYVVVHKINFEKAILYAKQRGFNACIDEILGEEE